MYKQVPVFALFYFLFLVYLFILFYLFIFFFFFFLLFFFWGGVLNPCKGDQIMHRRVPSTSDVLFRSIV